MDLEQAQQVTCASLYKGILSLLMAFFQEVGIYSKSIRRIKYNQYSDHDPEGATGGVL